MGCDIHAHVEIKVNGKWHHYNHPSADRSYTMFARMADVRNDDGIEPISAPRGLPEDVTFTTRFDHDRMRSDAFSESWLSAEEVAGLGEWMRAAAHREYRRDSYSLEADFGYIFGNGWDIKRYPGDYPKELQDARLVFWFDN